MITKNIKNKRKKVNGFTCTLPAKSVNEGLARGMISAFCSQADPTVEELCDVKTAVSEAVTNCIVHGYRNTIGLIYMQIRIFDGGKIYIKIRDRGCGIADIKQAMEPLFTTSPETERSGLGFSVMESFMDKLSVKSATGKGTTVTMVKRLKEKG